MNEITLSIIIVNYKSWIPLEKCLHSINNQIDINPEIIVVDNNSSDDFIHSFKKKFPKVLWVENKSNSGFSKGCNIGAKKASNKFLLFLNPDTYLPNDCLKNLFNKKLNFENSIIGIKQLNNKNKNTHAYGIFLNLYSFNGIARALYRLLRLKSKSQLEKLDQFNPDWISGSFIFISKRLFNIIGKWNENYFMYYEDMDLCKKARNMNYNVIMINDIYCNHFHGLSSRINEKTKIKSKTEVIKSSIKYIEGNFTGIEKYVLKGLKLSSVIIELVLVSPFSRTKRNVLINLLRKD